MGRKMLNTGLCISSGCDREQKRARMCYAHYQRFSKTGDTNPSMPITVRKGWHLHKTGYVVVPAYGHPNGNAAGSIMQHIKIMSEHIGRPLAEKETVHHKNGIRTDNRIENLELWASNHPKGTRIKDLIVHAKYILSEYGEDAEKYE